MLIDVNDTTKHEVERALRLCKVDMRLITIDHMQKLIKPSSSRPSLHRMSMIFSEHLHNVLKRTNYRFSDDLSCLYVDCNHLFYDFLPKKGIELTISCLYETQDIYFNFDSLQYKRIIITTLANMALLEHNEYVQSVTLPENFINVSCLLRNCSIKTVYNNYHKHKDITKIYQMLNEHLQMGNNIRQRDIPGFERKMIEAGLEQYL